MNHDIDLSVYYENRELKSLVNKYRSLIQLISERDDLPEDIKDMIRAQRTKIEQKKK
jgi:hypothetical protein